MEKDIEILEQLIRQGIIDEFDTPKDFTEAFEKLHDKIKTEEELPGFGKTETGLIKLGLDSLLCQALQMVGKQEERK